MFVQIPKAFQEKRWHFVFGVTKPWELRALGWHQFDLGLFWLRSFPPEGERISSSYYRGFWLRLLFWLPFQVRR